jgi:hypothetical protein
VIGIDVIICDFSATTRVLWRGQVVAVWTNLTPALAEA